MDAGALSYHSPSIKFENAALIMNRLQETCNKLDVLFQSFFIEEWSVYLMTSLEQIAGNVKSWVVRLCQW